MGQRKRPDLMDQAELLSRISLLEEELSDAKARVGSAQGAEQSRGFTALLNS